MTHHLGIADQGNGCLCHYVETVIIFGQKIHISIFIFIFYIQHKIADQGNGCLCHYVETVIIFGQKIHISIFIFIFYIQHNRGTGVFVIMLRL